MRFIRVVVTCLVLQLILLPITTFSTPESPEIIISQFKVTSNDGQFFMLYNNTDQEIDMGTVQLVYYNHYDYSQATSSKIIGLTGSLPAKSYYLVNDGPYVLCYKTTVNSVNLSFSSTKGSLQISKLEQASAGQPITSTIHDSVSWSKSSVEGVVKTPSDTGHFLLRGPTDVENNPVVTTVAEGSWQIVEPDSTDACSYKSTVLIDPEPLAPTNFDLLAPTPPPVTIISLFSAVETGPINRNAGLMAPVINEILPNPASPLKDAEDEFIEIYNPNKSNFDLTDFYIETGTTTKRKWHFPDGMNLPPESYSVFTARDFSITLSNSGGQIRVIGPNGKTVSETKEYGTAKDNYAWAMADSEWYWTVTPTPGEPNIITATGRDSAKTTLATNGQLLGAFTNSSAPSTSSSDPSKNPEVTTLHPSSLATVAVLAVGYGAYEYKQDLANKFRQFRSYRAARRKDS